MLRRAGLGFTAALFTLIACSSSKEEGGTPTQSTQYVEGFSPPAAGQDEVQVVSPIYPSIQPGRDVTYCSYVTNPFDHDVDVIASIGVQSKPGHHAILYDVGNAGTPGDTHECTDNDMNRARLIGGAVDSAQNFPIPEGIGLQVKARTTLLIQTHWINAGSKAFDGQAVFNMKVKPHDGSRKPAQSFTAYATKFEIGPHGPGSAVTECKVEEDLTMFLLAGHEHEWGSHVTIERVPGGGKDSPATRLLDVAWQPEFQTNPPRNSYTLDAPLVFKKGDIFRVRCEWNNTTDQPLTFPQEMCVGFGMYYPATRDIDCGDGRWGTADE